MNGSKKAKKKLVAPNLSLTLDRSEGSILSEDLDESGDLDLDDLDTPSENSNEFEWEGNGFIILCCVYLIYSYAIILELVMTRLTISPVPHLTCSV